MSHKKSFGTILRDWVELYIPVIAFCIMFALFCFQILVRYALSKVSSISVPWTTEVEQMCFLWVVMLGACYVQRSKGHVVFTLLYDVLSVKGKAIMSMISSALVTFACAVTIIPSLNYVWGLMDRHQVTSLLKIPKTVVFFPYVIFLVMIVAYGIMEIYEDIMVLRGNQHYIEKLLAESKSEAETAIEAAMAQKDEIEAAAEHLAQPKEEE